MKRCHWEMLKRIGDYATGELSSEESRHVERFVREDAGCQRLFEAYAQILALLRAMGEESPKPHKRTRNKSFLRATEEAHAGSPRRSPR